MHRSEPNIHRPSEHANSVLIFQGTRQSNKLFLLRYNIMINIETEILSLSNCCDHFDTDDFSGEAAPASIVLPVRVTSPPETMYLHRSVSVSAL